MLRQTGKQKSELAEQTKAASEAERNGSTKKPMTKAERQTEKNRQKTADRKTRDRKNTLMEVGPAAREPYGEYVDELQFMSIAEDVSDIRQLLFSDILLVFTCHGLSQCLIGILHAIQI